LSRLAKVCWSLTIVYWCGLYVLTHVPVAVPVAVPVTDKTAHFVSYALLACAVFISMHLTRRRPAAALGIFVLGVMLVYGAFDELTQIPVGRDGNILDWYADAAGAAVAVVLMTILFRR
jgi:VanZ family protein